VLVKELQALGLSVDLLRNVEDKASASEEKTEQKTEAKKEEAKADK
jgi:hypothetical protein